jgi:prevent-host-death family protein
MYVEIGAFDAKTRLSELLREVQRGQHYTITIRGQPVADLVPSANAVSPDVRAAVEAMRNMRKVVGVDEGTVAEWIAEGRR